MQQQLAKTLRLFVCGDVMTGRGIDQILSCSVDPRLFETYVDDAREYVVLAEQVNGKINSPVSDDYIWGDAMQVWKNMCPDIKIINLETAITLSSTYDANKGIHYRMHPGNIGILTAANIDICTLANNHILDWGHAGLKDTIDTLNKARIACSGAGQNKTQAMEPVVKHLNSGNRLLVFSAGTLSSGIPAAWAADSRRAGVYILSSLDASALSKISDHIDSYRQRNDLIVFSIHWGSNWGYEVADEFQNFAHALIDMANVDVIMGHSSHHPRPIEIYNGKPILYGCGDFINDYEGIARYEEYRGDLTLMYFLDFDLVSMALIKMTLVPMKIRNFRLHEADQMDADWMFDLVNRHIIAEKPLINLRNGFVYFTQGPDSSCC